MDAKQVEPSWYKPPRDPIQSSPSGPELKVPPSHRITSRNPQKVVWVLCRGNCIQWEKPPPPLIELTTFYYLLFAYLQLKSIIILISHNTTTTKPFFWRSCKKKIRMKTKISKINHLVWKLAGNLKFHTANTVGSIKHLLLKSCWIRHILTCPLFGSCFILPNKNDDKKHSEVFFGLWSACFLVFLFWSHLHSWSEIQYQFFKNKKKLFSHVIFLYVNFAAHHNNDKKRRTV